jgi:hypothetical protein
MSKSPQQPNETPIPARVKWGPGTPHGFMKAVGLDESTDAGAHRRVAGAPQPGGKRRDPCSTRFLDAFRGIGCASDARCSGNTCFV